MLKKLKISFCDAIRVINAKVSSRAMLGPHEVVLLVADACDDACIFCNYHSPHLKSPYAPEKGFMDRDNYKTLLKDLKALKVHKIRFSGAGEPLFNPDIIEFMKSGLDAGFQIAVNTNGIGLANKIGDRFARYKDVEYRVSLHAASCRTWMQIHSGKTEEDFDRLLEYIKYVIDETDQTVVLHNVICKLNYNELPEIVTLAKSLGVRELSFEQVIDFGNLDDSARGRLNIDERDNVILAQKVEEAMTLADRYGIRSNLQYIPLALKSRQLDKNGTLARDTRSIYKKIPCHVGYFFCLIVLNGMVMPCCSCNAGLGDTRKNTFREIWNSKKYRDFRYHSGRREFNKIPYCSYEECYMYKTNVKIARLFGQYGPTL